MLASPEFWVAVAFVIFVVAVFVPVKRSLLSALDARGDRIRSEIDNAQALRVEAQKVLAEYRRKQRDALTEVEQILDQAKQQAEYLQKQAQKDLETALQRREQAAMENIARAESQALEDVRNQAVDVAIAATAEVIAGQLNKRRANAIVNKAIRDLPEHLH